MLEFVRNIFHFEIAWKMRLKLFYYFAKFHALAHFKYIENRNKVSFSFVSIIYGLVWVVGYFLLLLIALFSLSVFTEDSRNESDIFLFVNTLEIVTIFFKGFSIYLLQVIQSTDLVLLINEAIAINQSVDHMHREITYTYGHRFVRLYNNKKCCVLLQFVLLFMCYYIYLKQSGHDAIKKVFGFLIVYTHFLTVVVSGLYIYGSLLLAYEFYHSLNRNLTQVLKKVEVNQISRTQMASYCQACDELDEISLTYTRISAYVGRIKRLFAVQITFELLISFLLITCALFYTFYALLSRESLATDNDFERLYGTFNSIMYSTINFTVYFIEIYTITCISNTVIGEAENLSTSIHKSVFSNADPRFIRSLQQLSLKTILEKPEISPMGLFLIDRSLVIGVCLEKHW
ncbi:uncharacterized protein LOC119078875 [Bradysia coprophila]|uniref:uncharacterized protein LOC119078875 n=1 Tax=Bradysia coprophila TaxID=38358 RepID=UPI00187DCB26|nr:uncharacterized protein LOC119078875 [Bradysia coprophila]